MSTKQKMIQKIQLAKSFGLFIGLILLGGATQPPSQNEANIYVELSKKVVPSVVNISTTTAIKTMPGGRGGQEDLFRRFFEDYFKNHGGGGGNGGGNRFGPGPDDEEGEAPPEGNKKKGGPKATSLGSGFVIDESGLVLTNNHVVAEADEIKIQFTEDDSETPTDGEVVGRDPELDLALIRVKTTRKLVALPFGDSDESQVGEYVMAVGNPFGHGHTVTHGIISAKGRKAPDLTVLANYLQTDASINPGNSGGPLLNLKGQVIGINNAIDQRAQGIGFAIPINLVKQVLGQLKSKGSVSRGYIGVLVEDPSPEMFKSLNLPKEKKAPVVSQVFVGEPAEKAGIKVYDLILEFNGKPIRNASDLINGVTSVKVGDSASVKILRDGAEKTLQITVAQRPGQKQMASRPKSKPKAKEKARIDTGLTLEEITAEVARDLGLSDKQKGVVVSDVQEASTADESGLMRGDVIVEVDRRAIKNVEEFYSIVKSKKPYLLRVRRQDPQGREMYSIVILNLKASD